MEDVVRVLEGHWSGIYDNPVTQRREFWVMGKITHERPRSSCYGLINEWGTYSERYST